MMNELIISFFFHLNKSPVNNKKKSLLETSILKCEKRKKRHGLKKASTANKIGTLLNNTK
jgi:hypothetical protein